ncbi:glycosyltransferase family 4 protein [Proteus penneri]|uniref:Gt1 n=1 Tax=Proteus penneri TaxID=102862 RepID=A0A385JNK6_9GAMM|nr:glycosyltransferase family 4 protein [Proteus penneri]AXY99942.1 gt1 [Proteus penneri]
MIAHFVYNLLSYSGAAFQAHSLCKCLGTKNNIIFNIGSSSKINYYNKDGIIIIDLPLNYLKRLFYITILFITLKIKVVHLHGWILTGLIPAIFLRKKIVLKTTMFGDDDIASIIKRNKKNLYFLKYLSSVISISTPIKKSNDKCIKNLALKCQSIYLPNGVVDDELILDNHEKKPIFCTVGVISDRKGTLDAIQYFINNYMTLPDSKLYIVGPTPEDDDYAESNIIYYQSCQKYSEKYPDKIIITGKLSKDKVYDIYKKSIAHIFLSRKEGMPNVILESMYFNCVPLITEIEGVAYDIIDNNKDGFIFKNREFINISFEMIQHIAINKLPHKKIMDKFLLKNLSIEHKKNYENIICKKI